MLGKICGKGWQFPQLPTNLGWFPGCNIRRAAASRRVPRLTGWRNYRPVAHRRSGQYAPRFWVLPRPASRVLRLWHTHSPDYPGCAVHCVMLHRQLQHVLMFATHVSPALLGGSRRESVPVVRTLQSMERQTERNDQGADSVKHIIRACGEDEKRRPAAR